MQDDEHNQVIQTVCTLHDGLACGLLAHVEAGMIEKITPADYPDPGYKGACAKGLSSHHWVYHPDRLQHPLKRVGERGAGKWQRISWEEAIDGITTQLKEIAERYGSGAIAWFISEFPLLSQAGYLRLISLTKGTWVEDAGYGDLSGPTADLMTFGRLVAFSWALLFKNPEFTIVWGANPADTNFKDMKAILQAKKKGCKVAVIDPRYTATAVQVDEHIPIRPGTDGALALGMINVILEEGLEDRPFIMEKTVGPLLVRADNGLFLRERDITGGAGKDGFMVWDEISGQARRGDVQGLKPALDGNYSLGGTDCRPAWQLLSDLVRGYTPEKSSEITDVPAETIRRLALDYATLKPANIYRGWGMQRTFHGDLSCRAINALAAVTGNVNLERTIPNFEDIVLPEKAGYDFTMPGGALNRLPIMNLYNAVTKGEPFPVKALCNTTHNFANQLPNAGKIINELFPRLELILVCDLFMTITARYADYVLPAASAFERSDLVPCFISDIPYAQLQQKVIAPLYESKSDFRIAAELGKRMGFCQHFDKSEEGYLEEILATHPALNGLTLEQLKKGPVRQIPPEVAPFKTPTGRIEFYLERLKAAGQELPVYLEPVESVRREKAREFSLSLLTPHPKYRMHSTLANVPELLEFDPEPLLEMNPVDAKPRDIEAGDVVYVFNDRGKVKLKVKLTEDIKSGVVSVFQGWWREHYLEGHHNDLTHDLINPVQNAIIGPNAALYDVLVEVRKA